VNHNQYKCNVFYIDGPRHGDTSIVEAIPSNGILESPILFHPSLLRFIREEPSIIPMEESPYLIARYRCIAEYRGKYIFVFDGFYRT